MRAVVLVGGVGSRLRPLTYSVPKPMLPVGHKPIIERLVANLVRGGVTDVTLALGFKPEPFIAAFPDGTCAGAQLHYAVEPEPYDTAGAVRFAADFAGIDDTFVVANGDVLTDLDVGALVAFHRDHDALATIHLTAVEDPSAFGVVATDANGRVDRFVEKPAPGTAPSNLINAGTYVLDPSVLELIPAGRKTSIERETFPAIVADGRLYATATADYWIDTGRPDLYLAANLDMLLGLRSHDTCTAVEHGADVADGATVHESLISAGAMVADGAKVVRSIVLDGAVVGRGATVTDSSVMGRIEPGATVTGCVIGAGAVVAAGEDLVAVRRPDPSDA
jgi:mannose-1-phosphate guanylyltransferase